MEAHSKRIYKNLNNPILKTIDDGLMEVLKTEKVLYLTKIKKENDKNNSALDSLFEKTKERLINMITKLLEYTDAYVIDEKERIYLSVMNLLKGLYDKVMDIDSCFEPDVEPEIGIIIPIEDE